MALKKEYTRRVISLILVFFTLFVVFSAIYFYLSSISKINSINDAISVLSGVGAASVLDRISDNASGLFTIVISQIVVFLLATISLVVGVWFISRLYLVEKKNALVDPLTGLYNKRAISFSLEREIRRAARSNRPLSVAVLDLDYFKKYNDTQGHVAGDRLLKRIGVILMKSVRQYDFVGRVGGEEFLIVFPEASLRQATEICERIRKKISTTRFPGERDLPNRNVTISVGVAEFSSTKKIKKERLIGEADSYLYEAKKEGRNRVIAK